MGKIDHDQHQIDKNHYCSVTFSKIMNGNRLIVLQNPCMTEENEHFIVLFKQIDTYRMKNMSHNWVLVNRKPTGFGGRITFF